MRILTKGKHQTLSGGSVLFQLYIGNGLFQCIVGIWNTVLSQSCDLLVSNNTLLAKSIRATGLGKGEQKKWQLLVTTE